jgi:hypothetical protein
LKARAQRDQNEEYLTDGRSGSDLDQSDQEFAAIIEVDEITSWFMDHSQYKPED